MFLVLVPVKFKFTHVIYFRGYVREFSITKVFIEENIIKTIKIWTKWELHTMGYGFPQANSIGDHIYLLFLYN
jgi:hypothetical protein